MTPKPTNAMSSGIVLRTVLKMLFAAAIVIFFLILKFSAQPKFGVSVAIHMQLLDSSEDILRC